MKKKPKIKFVSYDGEYPNLCRGQLVLKIGRKTYKFGKPRYDFSSNQPKDIYSRFWTSGGEIRRTEDWSDMWSEKGEWNSYIDSYVEKKLPKEVIDNIDEIMRLFNENVPQGCCGGCI